MTIQNTVDWFKQAVPVPDKKTLGVQLGCHFEEGAEMLEAMAMDFTELHSRYMERAHQRIRSLSDALKSGAIQPELIQPLPMLDSLCDQIVTAIGVAHMLGFDIEGALNEVNRSNWSKFEDGKPVFDANGKIKKGRNYSEPNLLPYLGKETQQ